MDGNGMVVTAFMRGAEPRQDQAPEPVSEVQRGRLVRDVMTSPVVTVPPGASIKVVAEVLLSNRVSAAPVVDPHGHVLGVVSEADLLVKEIAMGSGAHLPWLEGRHAQDIRRRREAVSAEDLMTSPAISVHPDTLLRQAARTMCEKRIKRLPVLADGWLVGIVSRADVLRVYLLADEQLRRHAERLLQGTLGSAGADLEVTALEGLISVTGVVDTRSEAELVGRLLTRLEGVVGVEARVTWRVDDHLADEIRRVSHL
ncbi:MAG: CBS domain-containing protein [Candidatus Dormiibacterota bacterium]